MPENKSDYVSEGGKVMLETMAGKFTPKGLEFSQGEVKKGDPGKTVKIESLAKDQESFTGKEEGFFSKFGSLEADK